MVSVCCYRKAIDFIGCCTTHLASDWDNWDDVSGSILLAGIIGITIENGLLGFARWMLGVTDGRCLILTVAGIIAPS
jgi:hypothetical protein